MYLQRWSGRMDLEMNPASLTAFAVAAVRARETAPDAPIARTTIGSASSCSWPPAWTPGPTASEWPPRGFASRTSGPEVLTLKDEAL
jgi:hypothetical protein